MAATPRAPAITSHKDRAREPDDPTCIEIGEVDRTQQLSRARRCLSDPILTAVMSGRDQAIESNRAKLTLLANRLLSDETIEGVELQQLLAG